MRTPEFFKKHGPKSEKGVFLVLIGIAIFTLLGIGSLSVDLGYTMYQQVLLQRASDTAALAAVSKVQTGDANVIAAAQALLAQNSVSYPSEVPTIDCGMYNPTTKRYTACASGGVACVVGVTTCCSGCGDTRATSVRVKTSRIAPSFLARVIGIQQMNPTGLAVAQARFANSVPCIRPFGLVGQPTGNNIIDNTAEGSTFVISTQGQGNWGKLDIGGNMSSGTNFSDAIQNGACDGDATVGATVGPATGNGGTIAAAFQSLVNTNTQNGLYFAIVTPFPNGNSGEVTILGYVIVDFISQIASGNNWQGTFRMVDKTFVSAPVAGGSGAVIARFLH